MQSISVVSLLPLSSAVLSTFLAASTFRSMSRARPTIVFFFLLNVATMLWSFFYGVELNLNTTLVIDVAPVGSPEWVLYVLQIIGLSAAPTYWFLFAAAFAGKRTWVQGWRLMLAHVPLLYGVLIAASNPTHQLFVSQSEAGGPVGYGYLAYPNQTLTFLLVGWGTWLILRTLWRPKHRRSRRSAIALGFATVLPFLGGLAWAVRVPLGLPITVNPVPVMFALLNTVLLYQVIRTGFAEIIPVAALQAFRMMSDAVLVIDDEGLLLELNQAARKLLPEAEPGMPLAHASPDIAHMVDQCVAWGTEYSDFELSIEERAYWGRLRLTLDRSGSPVGYITMLTDVTELRQAQSDLVELNDVLHRRVAERDRTNRQLETANRELGEATEAKSRFLASMSHELRTPLNSIIGFSGIMLQELAGEVNEEQREQLEMIQASGKRLLDLISDILDLSKIEAGRQTITRSEASLGEMIAAVRNQVAPLAADKGLELTIDQPARDTQMVTDRTRVEQVLINLLTNAIKFTDQGRVALTSEVDDGWVEIHVADSGIGIPKEKLDEIFSEFSRIEQDGILRPGVGLGLSISSKLAVLLGGSLTVTSELGHGSTFSLGLPVDDS